MNRIPTRKALGVAIAAVSVLAAASVLARDDRPPPTARFAAKLTPLQEVPAVSSVAKGRIVLKIDEAAQTIEYELSYEDLEGAVAQAHIHTAQAGVNGGIMVWLCGTAALPGPAGTPVCPASPGTVSGVLTAAQVVGPAAQGIAASEFAEVVQAIRNGVAYANVHSAKFGGGEVRGQLRRAPRRDGKDD
jgi:hypothetical protein